MVDDGSSETNQSPSVTRESGCGHRVFQHPAKRESLSIPNSQHRNSQESGAWELWELELWALMPLFSSLLRVPTAP